MTSAYAAIMVLLGILSAPAPQNREEPDLSGDWELASGTTDRTRGGATGEQPTRTYMAEGQAFNCGRGCRIRDKRPTLTIENARLRNRDTVPTVTIVVDGRPHAVVDSVNRGRTIETVARWQDGKLVITSTLFGQPATQTISLERKQLVVAKLYASGTKLTLRYTKK